MLPASRRRTRSCNSSLVRFGTGTTTRSPRRGGLTFKASSLIAKALHPDATPSAEIRLNAFKAFSAWKNDRDVARRR